MIIITLKKILLIIFLICLWTFLISIFLIDKIGFIPSWFRYISCCGMFLFDIIFLKNYIFKSREKELHEGIQSIEYQIKHNIKENVELEDIKKKYQDELKLEEINKEYRDDWNLSKIKE